MGQRGRVRRDILNVTAPEKIGETFSLCKLPSVKNTQRLMFATLGHWRLDRGGNSVWKDLDPLRSLRCQWQAFRDKARGHNDNIA